MRVPNLLILPGLGNYEGDHHHILIVIIVVNHDDGCAELETTIPAVEVCGMQCMALENQVVHLSLQHLI